MSYKNAGIKTQAEAQKRLEAGEVFYNNWQHSGVIEIKYDASFIMQGASPYRYGSDSLSGMWYNTHVWLTKAQWTNNIPEQGVLCWVSDISNTERLHVANVVKYRTNYYEHPYKTTYTKFIYATPLTATEIKGYIHEI